MENASDEGIVVERAFAMIRTIRKNDDSSVISVTIEMPEGGLGVLETTRSRAWLVARRFFQLDGFAHVDARLNDNRDKIVDILKLYSPSARGQ